MPLSSLTLEKVEALKQVRRGGGGASGIPSQHTWGMGSSCRQLGDC